MLRDAQIKTLLLQTFQDFLLNRPTESDDDVIESLPVKVVKPKKEAKKEAKKEVKKVARPKKEPTEKEKIPAKKEPKKSTKNQSQIDRLKGYIFKCGVRKVWY